jgi:hypothetical protein
MVHTTPQIWQMAAGEAGRYYSDLFLEHDIMFLGPGKFKSFHSPTYDEAVNAGLATSGSVAYIKSFYENVRPGDIVLMRKGYRVEALGVVADAEYEWSEDFDDVYGWDLQHTRRVVWQEHLAEELKQMQAKCPLFNGRKQIPTFTRVNVACILEPLRPLFSRFKSRPLKALPHSISQPLTMDEVGQQLFSRGVANDAVDKVIAAIERQRRLLRWYSQFGAVSGRPTEHEVVAHTVLPLLLALGWSEQLLAVEWKRVDLAAFWTTPTNEEHCVLVCEAKTRNNGLQDVRTQAFQYVEKLGLVACQKVLLTDGGRFYLYQRSSESGSWSDQALGYLNVEKIRTNHIAPSGTNAIDTIVALTPAAAGRCTLWPLPHSSKNSGTTATSFGMTACRMATMSSS